MRMLVTWLVALILVAIVAFTWYVTQPLVVKTVRGVNDVMETGGWNSTLSSQTFTVLEFLGVWWGPLVILALLLWAFISAVRRDVESEIYG